MTLAAAALWRRNSQGSISAARAWAVANQLIAIDRCYGTDGRTERHQIVA